MKSSRSAPVRTLSFSGVDGAGKSTQIELLRHSLEQQGVSVQIFRFWDDVAALTRFREQAGHKVFKGEKGIGTPEAPVNRRDKNVRGWPMTFLRLFLYLLDAFSLRGVFGKALRGDADVIIFDRYTYDELANLELNHPLMRFYARILLSIVPRPDISFVLDADPVAARARKPEYPIEFLRFNREAYLHLSRIFSLTVIPPGEIAVAQREILAATLCILGTDSGSAEIESNRPPGASPMSAPPTRPAAF